MDERVFELFKLLIQSVISLSILVLGYYLGKRENKQNKSNEVEYKFLCKLLDNLNSTTFLIHKSHTLFKRIKYANSSNDLNHSIDLFKEYRDELHTFYSNFHNSFLFSKISKKHNKLLYELLVISEKHLFLIFNKNDLIYKKLEKINNVDNEMIKKLIIDNEEDLKIQHEIINCDEILEVLKFEFL